MNAICERVIGTLRRGLLDRVLILGELHLALVLGAWSTTTATGHTKPATNDLQMPNPSPPGTRLSSTTRDPYGEDLSSQA